METVCVFCGSKAGSRPSYEEAAKLMGKEIARQELGLVYGGERVGLMGILADAVLEESGEVAGVIPRRWSRGRARTWASPSSTSWARCTNARG